MKNRGGLLCALTLLTGLTASTASAEGLPAAYLQRIKLPPGFAIDVYADHLKDAREMALGPSGTLFVSTRSAGNVYAVVDRAHQNRADHAYVIASGLENPNGVALRDGALYVAERSRILRFDDIEHHLDHPPTPVVVRDDYPTHPHHGWKFIAFGPDGWLYVPVGSPCNVCQSDEIYASITRLSPDGKQREIVAHGVRNTVGFAWHPTTKKLWFTDNGRDEMGDDLPPDELNRADAPGQDYGFPYCHGTNINDPEFNQSGRDHPCDKTVAPVAELGAHVAALGMRFYTGTMFPAEYRNNIFIAEHGSWNRSVPIGYRVVRIKLDGEKVVGQEVFAQGWLPVEAKSENPHQPNKLRADESADRHPTVRTAKQSQAWGRPVDVLVMPDGALLVSDDEAGVIYRIRYAKP